MSANAFTNNMAKFGVGGAFCGDNINSLNIDVCTFFENSAQYSGGGLVLTGSVVELTNSIISGNSNSPITC